MIKTRVLLITAVALTLMGTQAPHAMEDKSLKSYEEACKGFLLQQIGFLERISNDVEGCAKIRMIYYSRDPNDLAVDPVVAQEAYHYGGDYLKHDIKIVLKKIDNTTDSFNTRSAKHYPDEANPFAETITVAALGLNDFGGKDKIYPILEEARNLVSSATETLRYELILLGIQSIALHENLEEKHHD